MALSSAKSKLIAVIGDEDTCTGFILSGIGELDRKRRPNFLVVDKDTHVEKIEEVFLSFTSRDDIAIILIVQNVAEIIRHLIESHHAAQPAILEIPSKDCPYDANKDTILKKAKSLYSADDFR